MLKKIYFLLLILFFTCCVKERDLSQNTVIAHILSQPDGLHPINDNSSIRTYIFQYTQKTLIKLDLKSLDYIPYLVKEIPEGSPDHLSFTYEIKEGITWDDGTPFTAQDVDFSTKLMLSPLSDNAQIRGNYTSVIKSIELYPDNPLKFTMHALNINWENRYIFSELYLMQKSIWDKEGVLDKVSYAELLNPDFKASEIVSNWFNNFNHADNSYVPEKLVGLGAYQITQWETNQYITLERKKNWWGEKDTSIYNKAYPDKMIFKVINEDASTYLALKNQEIDVTMYIGTVNLMKLQQKDYFNKNYDSDFLNTYNYNYIGLNMKPDGMEYKPFFVDQKVRRAMAYLTPIDEIIEVMVNGKAIRQTSETSPLKSTYNDTLQLIPLDIEKAKTLLTEAGWMDTDGDNIRDKVINGIKIPFKFRLSYMSSPISKEIVLMIKESMYKAGVEVEPTPMDFTLFYKNAMDHNFDAMLGGWGGSASYSNPYQLWHTSSWVTKGSNFCGFGDAASDALIDEANLTLDPEEHKNALLKLQARIYEDQPYIFLYSTKNKFAIHKRFDNRNMYYERPGVMLQNLKLNISSKNMTPTNGL